MYGIKVHHILFKGSPFEHFGTQFLQILKPFVCQTETVSSKSVLHFLSNV